MALDIFDLDGSDRTIQEPPCGPRHAESSTANDIAVDIRGLRVAFGRTKAVHDLDLHVRRGEIFALLGVNGAGKTTTLNVLTGLVEPQSGHVAVLGLDPIADRVRLQACMGVQQQEGGFLGELTVLETLRLWSRLVERPDRPKRLLKEFGLTSRSNHAVGSLSGGEKRRLDLAMAVWGSPELVILDEPTTGLDPEARRRTWDVIRALGDGRSTVLFTTHYLEEAEALADRIAVMKAGRAAVCGSLADVVAARPSRFSSALPVHAPALPVLRGATKRDLRRRGSNVTVETSYLQRDLTIFLEWAALNGVNLRDLRAAPASLADVYQSLTDDKG